MEGKRKRKVTKQFSIEIAPPKKKVAKKPVGSGTKLQDIPSGMMILVASQVYLIITVDYTLSEKFKADGLRMLYRLCFEANGKVSTRVTIVQCNVL